MLPEATFDFSCLDEQNSSKDNYMYSIVGKAAIAPLKTFKFTFFKHLVNNKVLCFDLFCPEPIYLFILKKLECHSL